MQRQAVAPLRAAAKKGEVQVIAGDLDRTLKPGEKTVPSVEVLWDTLNEQGSDLSRLKTDHKNLQKEAERLKSKLRAANDEAEALRTCLDTVGVVPKSILEEKVKDSREARKEREKDAKELKDRDRTASKDDVPTGDESGTGKADLSSEVVDASAEPSAPADPDTTRLTTPPTPSSKGAAKPKVRRKKSPRSAADDEAKNWKSPLGPPREKEEEEKDERENSSAFSFRPKALVNNNLYELARPFLRIGNTDKPAIKGDPRARAFYAFEECLRRGISPSKWDGPLTPLSAMVKSQEPEMVNLLMRARASADQVDEKGVSVLHTLSFHGDAAMIKSLLDGKANPDVVDKHGQTPLFFAPNTAICSLLYSGRADPTVMNAKGQSALHLAARAGNESVMRWLIQHVSREVLNLQDKHGATATYYARLAGVKHSTVARIYFHQPTADPAKGELHGRDLLKHPHRAGEDQIEAANGKHKGGAVSHFIPKPKIQWDFTDIHKDDGPKPRPKALMRKGEDPRLKALRLRKSAGTMSSRSSPKSAPDSEGGRTLRPEELAQYMQAVREDEAAKLIQAVARRSFDFGDKAQRPGDSPRIQFADDVENKKQELEKQMQALERQRTQLDQIGKSDGSKLKASLMQADATDDATRKKATPSPPLSSRMESSGRTPSSPSASPRNRSAQQSPNAKAFTQSGSSSYGSSYADRRRRIEAEEERLSADRQIVSGRGFSASSGREKTDAEKEEDERSKRAAEMIQTKYRDSVVMRNLQAAPTDGTWGLCKALRNQQAVKAYKEIKAAKDKAKEDNVRDTYSGSIARMILHESNKEGKAATKIQARFRGNAARKQVNDKKAEKAKKDAAIVNELHDDAKKFNTNTIKDNAATKIQAHVRGYQVRDHMKADDVAGFGDDAVFGDLPDFGDLGGLDDLNIDELGQIDDADNDNEQAEDDIEAAGEEMEEEQGEEAEEEEGDEFVDDDDDGDVEEF